MIDKNILDYLNQYAKDYPIETLKEQLRNSGYSVQDIEDSANFIQTGGLTGPSAVPTAAVPQAGFPWLWVTLGAGVMVVIIAGAIFFFRGGEETQKTSVTTPPVNQASTAPVNAAPSTGKVLAGAECNPLAGKKVLEASGSISVEYNDKSYPPLTFDADQSFPKTPQLDIDPISVLEPSLCSKYIEDKKTGFAQFVLHNNGQPMMKVVMLQFKSGTYDFGANSGPDYKDSEIKEVTAITVAVLDPSNLSADRQVLDLIGGQLLVGPNPIGSGVEVSLDFRGVRGTTKKNNNIKFSGVIRFKMPGDVRLDTPSFLPTCSSLGGELCPVSQDCDLEITARDNTATQRCCAKNFCGQKLQN